MSLLPWQSGDEVAFRRLTQDPRVMRYVSNGEPWSDEKTLEFVVRQRQCFATRGFCLWKMVSKETETICGMCGLQPLEETPDIEIGWWLAPELWGQGIATEAARAVLLFGFGSAALARIVAVALPENTASTHIMEKLGMLYTGRVVHQGFEVERFVITRAQYEKTKSA